MSGILCLLASLGYGPTMDDIVDVGSENEKSRGELVGECRQYRKFRTQ